MWRATVSMGMALFASGWLTLPVAGETSAPGVKDHAGFFSPSAASRANEDIQELRDRYDLSFVLETFSAPPLLRSLFQQLKKPEERERGLEELSKEYAKKANPNGVYILIFREPQPFRVYVHVSQETKGLAANAPTQLRQLLANALEKKQDDNGLHDVIGYLRNSLAAVLGQGRAATPPFQWSGVLWTVVSCIALGLALELLRGWTGGPIVAPQDRPTGASGGGGILTGLFATMTGIGIRGFWDPSRTTPNTAAEPVAALAEPEGSADHHQSENPLYS